MKREEKLDFAVESSIVTLASGAILSQVLMMFFVYHSSGILRSGFFLILNAIKYFLLGFPGLLIFALAFRLAVYLLDGLSLSGGGKLILAIVAGSVLIVLIEHLFLDFREQEARVATIFILSFILPFAAWAAHRNIWDSIQVEPKQESDVLDDVGFRE